MRYSSLGMRMNEYRSPLAWVGKKGPDWGDNRGYVYSARG